MFLNEFKKGATNIHFSLIDDCNLKCAYCFEHGFFKKQKNTFENFLKTLKMFPYLRIVWFWGGEPTLNMGLMQEMLEYVEKNDKKIEFYLSTNGTNPEVLDLFDRYKCFKAIQISIDGIKECHDLMRNNSWDSAFFVWKEARNIASKKTGKIVMANPVICKKTLKYFVENVKFYREVLKRTYAPVMDMISSEDLENWWYSLSEQDKEFVRNHFRNMKRNLALCMAGRSVQLVDTDGDIWMCHGAKYTRKRENMKYWLGNLDKGIISWKATFTPKRNMLCNQCKTNYCRVCWFQGDCKLFQTLYRLINGELPLKETNVSKFDLWQMRLDEKMEYYG